MAAVLWIILSRIKLGASEAMRVHILIQVWNNKLERSETVDAVRTVWTLGIFLGAINVISLTIKCGYVVKIGVEDEFKFLDWTTGKKKNPP